MNTLFKVYFKVSDLGLYGTIPGLKETMENELIRVYNIYSDKANSGITELLNDAFEKLYPNYFEENKGKEWYELNVYNKFMADGYNQLIADDMNKTNISPILDFYVDPEEVVFKGMLKVDHRVKIEFYMKED